jgi:hypothetical protein
LAGLTDQQEAGDQARLSTDRPARKTSSTSVSNSAAGVTPQGSWEITWKSASLPTLIDPLSRSS